MDINKRGRIGPSFQLLAGKTAYLKVELSAQATPAAVTLPE